MTEVLLLTSALRISGILTVRWLKTESVVQSEGHDREIFNESKSRITSVVKSPGTLYTNQAAMALTSVFVSAYYVVYSPLLLS